jgi:hypothetical protein
MDIPRLHVQQFVHSHSSVEQNEDNIHIRNM